MRVYPATIRSYCFLHSLRSFAKTNSAKKRQKNPVSNAQTTHVAWETAPQVYCQRLYKMYVNATNHTGLIFEFFVSAICYHQNYKPRGIYQLSARVSPKVTYVTVDFTRFHGHLPLDHPAVACENTKCYSHNQILN